jgi:hypothetical protein
MELLLLMYRFIFFTLLAIVDDSGWRKTLAVAIVLWRRGMSSLYFELGKSPHRA